MNAVRKLSENSFVQMENGTGHKIKNKTKIENNNISDSSLFFFFLVNLFSFLFNHRIRSNLQMLTQNPCPYQWHHSLHRIHSHNQWHHQQRPRPHDYMVKSTIVQTLDISYNSLADYHNIFFWKPSFHTWDEINYDIVQQHHFLVYVSQIPPLDAKMWKSDSESQRFLYCTVVKHTHFCQGKF